MKGAGGAHTIGPQWSCAARVNDLDDAATAPPLKNRGAQDGNKGSPFATVRDSETRHSYHLGKKMTQRNGQVRAPRAPLATWQTVGVGVVAEVIPPLVVVFMGVVLGIAQLPKSNALIVSLMVGVAAMAWCLQVSQWWRQWVTTLKGVDHIAVERLARQTGLIWGRL
jgi:hypothetical protein